MLNKVVRALSDIGLVVITIPVLKKGFKRYKEILYGVAAGVSVWMLDAAMHADLHGQLNWGGFTKELVANDGAQLLFRALFVVVAAAFGISLWRGNQRQSQAKDLHAAFDLLYRQIANPLFLVVGYSQMLSLKEGWPVGREAIELVDEIQINARKIREMLRQLPPPGMPIEEEAFAKLGLTQAWETAAEAGASLSGYARPATRSHKRGVGEI